MNNGVNELRFRLKGRLGTELWDYAGPFATFEEALTRLKFAPDGDYLITDGGSIVWPQIASTFRYN